MPFLLPIQLNFLWNSKHLKNKTRWNCCSNVIQQLPTSYVMQFMIERRKIMRSTLDANNKRASKQTRPMCRKIYYTSINHASTLIFSLLFYVIHLDSNYRTGSLIALIPEQQFHLTAHNQDCLQTDMWVDWCHDILTMRCCQLYNSSIWCIGVLFKFLIQLF